MDTHISRGRGMNRYQYYQQPYQGYGYNHWTQF